MESLPAGGYRRPDMRALLTLAWPIVVSRASQTIVGFADAVMVSPLGEDALAAVTTGAMNAFLAFIFPMGLVFIVGSFAAQLFGRGDPGGARRYGVYGLIISLMAGVASVAAIPLVPELVALVDMSPAVSAGVTTYLDIRLLAATFVVGLEALGAYYGGLGNTRLPMVAQLVAMGANVALNAVLIEGGLGIPALGIAGAAWASVLATAIAFVGLLVAFLRHAGEPQPAPVGRLRVSELWRVVRFGGPSGLNWFLEFGAFMYFIDVVVAGLGTSALAGFMAVMQLNSMSFMPAFGIASSGAVFVGQAIGADRKDDVGHTVRLTLIAAAVWQGAVGVLYVVIPALLLSPFARGEGMAASLVVVAIPMLRVSAAWQLFDSVASVLAEALRAAGDTTFPLVARIVIAWVFFTPVASLVVGRTGSSVVATLVVVGYIGMVALVVAWRFRRGTWRSIALVEHAPLVEPGPAEAPVGEA